MEKITANVPYGIYKIQGDNPARVAKFYADYALAGKIRKWRAPTKREKIYPHPLPDETMQSYCARFDKENHFRPVATLAIGPAWHSVTEDADYLKSEFCED